MPKDLFSEDSEKYRKFRPTYPAAWYDWLLKQTRETHLAWDVGTGNGQAATVLAEYFDRVLATDLSEAQLSQALRHPKVQYRVSLAHQSPCPTASCDLITVAQALHWFDLPAFYDAAKASLKSGGTLAVWGYGLIRFSSAIWQTAFDEWHDTVVAPYWDPERQHVAAHYATLPFPYPTLPGPTFHIEASFDKEALENYINTWSCVRNYRKAKGSNPVDQLMARIANSKGNPVQKVRFPLFYKVGRKD